MLNTTKKCELLMKFLLNKNCMKHITQSTQSLEIIKQLYNEMVAADAVLKEHKSKDPEFYKIKLKKIENATQITKPKTFNKEGGLIQSVEEHIDKFSFFEIMYSFHLLDRSINIYFILEKSDVDINLDLEPDLNKFNCYVDNIFIWLSIINKHATNKCSSHFVSYIYFTSLKKELPKDKSTTLSQLHINTAFTYACPTNLAEIVIFRKEEWFKVFIHESFHNFGLDFASMDNTSCSKIMLGIFHITSDVHLFESYAEFWAKFMNIILFSYHLLDDKEDIDTFIKYTDFLLNYERVHSFFQTAKVLNYMGLTYTDLYNAPEKSKKNYKEDTNVFAYYVVSLILTNNYPQFVSWCYENNSNSTFLQFKQTKENQQKYCDYIQSNYLDKQLLKGMQCYEKILHKIIKLTNGTNHAKNAKSLNYIANNLRLSLCETE
jgi:hypothetical protein